MILNEIDGRSSEAPDQTPAPDIRLPDNGLWRCDRDAPKTVWRAGAATHDLGAKIANALGTEDAQTEISDLLRTVPNQFAIVVRAGTRTVFAVDRVRSIPLIWTRTDTGALIVAQCGNDLFEGLSDRGAPSPAVDPDQARAVAMAGYTVGPGTLYRGVTALLAGEFVIAEDGKQPETFPFFRYLPWQALDTAPVPEKSAGDALQELLLDALRDTIRLADGRCIAVPLSAGLDSRYVASGLKELGYDNVITFSYGQPGNREAQAAQVIAKELGFRWTFYAYQPAEVRKAFQGEAYREFMGYSDSLTAVHFPQDFIAVSGLLKDGTLPADAFVVNGQSGDFLTGNHIPATLAGGSDGGDVDHGAVSMALLKKHFSLWEGYNTAGNRGAIGELLQSEFDMLSAGELPTDAAQLFGLYEASEYVDRQSKYVVNGQRAYEALGLGWDLPLWHGALIDFFAALPLSAKAGQKLYRETLMRMNWQGVWHNIPVNSTRLRPWWLPPVRNAAKLLHAPLGKAAWHRFELRYLKYFMSPLCSYAVRDWKDVAGDKRGPRAAIAYHIEDYLQQHGLTMREAAGG